MKFWMFHGEKTSNMSTSNQSLVRISDVDGSNEIHGYVIPAETISEVTPCSSTTERNWEVFDAVTNEDDGYVIPAQGTSEISRNKQH